MKNIDLILAREAISRLASKEMPVEIAERVIAIGAQIDSAVAGQNGVMEKLGLEKQPGANGQLSWNVPREKAAELQAAIEEYKMAEVEFDEANLLPYGAFQTISPADLMALNPLLKRE